MPKNVTWLFFDIGSTLVDETIAYSHRFRDIAEQASVPYELVLETARKFYHENKKGDQETAKYFGVPLPKWHSEDEVLYPDAKDCLAVLKQTYHIGIIANQLPGTAARLAQHGLLPFIDLIIASAEEGVAKPDPRIFEIALERSGCTPEESCMIGDRIDNDILPAKQMGMHTVWIKQGFGKYWNLSDEAEKPEQTVYDLTQLCNIL